MLKSRELLIVIAAGVTTGLTACLPVWNQPTWTLLTEQRGAHSPPFSSGLFVDGRTGLAVSTSQVKRSSDQGSTWVSVYEVPEASLDSIRFGESEVGFIYGSQNRRPIILRTDTEGEFWQRLILSPSEQNKSLESFTRFFDGCPGSSDSLWVVGDVGILDVKLIDSHIPQIEIAQLSAAPLFSISCDQNGEVWAVGDKGGIYHYDGRWRKKTSDKDSFFTRVKSVSDTVWVMGRNTTGGILLRSRDKGATWEVKTPAEAEILFDISMENNTGWLVGSSGKIYRTLDNGDTWTGVASPTTNDLLQISCVKSQECWIFGDKSTVLRLSR